MQNSTKAIGIFLKYEIPKAWEGIGLLRALPTKNFTVWKFRNVR